ncbi:serine protease snake-like [Vanessa cardui]|uniref:serine protease snake-like n=1 Tax=Vanessa cardui TaxID=171605 RepID=UPI001F13390B|nr:serine protease snake-like [Vanessa cardui]
MSSRSIFSVKLTTILFILVLPLYALSQTQGVIREDVNRSRLMFDGAKVADIIDFNYDQEDPCEYKEKDKKRNFSTPNRRVSEVKCLEYVWESLQSELMTARDELCLQQIIVGGRPAFYGEFPHMGALGWRSAQNNSEWIYKCGATLISEKFMITSAHCLYVPRRDLSIVNPTPEVVKIGDKFIINAYPSENEKYRYADFDKLIVDIKEVRGRTINKEKGPKLVPILRIIKHDLYKAPKRYYDIAIIELAEAVSIGPLIRPACLWSSSDTSDLNKLSITGWGVTDPGSPQISAELQVAEVDLIDDNTCDEMLKPKRNRHWMGLADHQICAGHLAGGIDTCQGDSGGPLQAKINLTQKWPMYYLVGVTSFGVGCARANTPSVYVRTSSFIDWIESIVWPNAQ